MRGCVRGRQEAGVEARSRRSERRPGDALARQQGQDYERKREQRNEQFHRWSLAGRGRLDLHVKLAVSNVRLQV